MNPDTMEFKYEKLIPLPDDWVRFKVGEELEIRGIIFRVERIKRKKVELYPIRMARKDQP